MTSNKLPTNILSRKVVKVLEKDDFIHVRTTASHRHFKKEGVNTIVTVSVKKRIPRGTLTNILKQAGYSKDDFLERLKDI